MTERKLDAARILAHLEQLRESTWIGEARRWWPKFLFRFDDLQNAISILTQGRLLCRNNRGTAVETACQIIIEGTNEQWKNYVRLYFRPRTPTQYQVEGFRPKGQFGSLQAHMPIPVFFMLDAAEILTRQTTFFSDGNLAANSPRVGDDADMFENIPFQQVYHDTWMPDGEKSSIRYHRHAETIVPDELQLDGVLKYIYLRSPAEKETLLNHLSEELANKYMPIMHQGSRANLHFRKWTYVESVSLEQNKVTLVFNDSSITPGPFHARLDLLVSSSGQRLKWEDASFYANKSLVVSIPQLAGPIDYSAKFSLDGIVAYKGKYRISTPIL